MSYQFSQTTISECQQLLFDQDVKLLILKFIINVHMLKIILIALTLTLTQTQLANLCPNDQGLVISGKITFYSNINQASSLTLIPNENTITYNHTLTSPFNQQPGVALSIGSFSSQPGNFLMFSTKALPSVSFTTLFFLLRFYQKYTLWISIQLGFLAETRSDIEADYYQIDTRQLGTNSTSKAVEVILPIQSTFVAPVAVYFLSGFQLASLSLDSINYTPFQVGITAKSSSSSSIVLVISTASSSQIFSLLISYIAFENKTNQYNAGVLQFNAASASFLNAPVTIPSSSLAFINGISGFVIPNIQSSISFESILISNSALQFNINPSTTYINFQFFTIPDSGNVCYFCEAHPYISNGVCVSQCPNGNITSNNQCTICSSGEYWNGTQCLLHCTGGRNLNLITNSCECPSGLIWNGNSCISCPSGQNWNSTLGSCACPDSNHQFWNGTACQTLQCPSNQVLNPISLQCECSYGSNWNGLSCVTCDSSQIWNGTDCICSLGLIWNGASCTNCPQNMIWNSGSLSCVCIQNYYFNGVQCITCTGGMIFDTINNICYCNKGQVWNGTLCVIPCTSPFVYSNGQCVCPIGTTQTNGNCLATPSCSNGQIWNGSACSSVTCAVGFVWNGTACIQYVQACPLNTYWNGIVCTINSISCPAGSNWNGTYCAPAPSCPIGTYLSGSKCIFFPQLCLPSYSWNGTACLAVGLATSCSNQQIFNGTNCVDIICSDGRIWSSLLNQCVCNSSSYWNGLGCIQCPVGQIFISGGCGCSDGYFLVQKACYSLQEVYCSFVNSASWNGTNCICDPGFTAVGVNCLCNGLVVNGTCNICYNIPNSTLINGSCQCLPGFYLIFGQCKAFSSNGTATACQPGTILSNKVCVPCSGGCLSCISQTVCIQCSPQFTYNWNIYTCQQICGDGFRFSLPCDDGNNVNGDGCSSDCKVESGFTCFGGSPISSDTCTQFLPSKITANLTGTSHLYGSINVNLKLNYLPSNFTNPSTPCTDLCQQLLQVDISSGFNSYLSIITKYFPGTLSFSSEINFGKEPIGPFTLKVQINPSMASLYFPSIINTQIFYFSIYPSFLSIYSPTDVLK